MSTGHAAQRVQRPKARWYAYTLPAPTEGNHAMHVSMIRPRRYSSPARGAGAGANRDRCRGPESGIATSAGSSQVQPQQAPAEIQESAPPASSSRYSFNRVDNGFLRLDNESGQVAYCNPRAVGWACQAAAIDRAALETEIASLQKQVASLKKLDTEIAQLTRRGRVAEEGNRSPEGGRLRRGRQRT